MHVTSPESQRFHKNQFLINHGKPHVVKDYRAVENLEYGIELFQFVDCNFYLEGLNLM